MDSDADDVKPVETWSPTFLPCKTPLDSYWTELLSTYRADWNDCLNLNCFSDTPGESFQTVENNDTGVAESVFIGGMFVLYGGQYADIIEHYGKLTGMDDANVAKEAANIRAKIGQVSEAVKTAGWDGEWFVRAYDAYSRKVGTHEDTEGQIYIEPQGMCVMAGIGLDDGKAQQAPKSVKERLTCDWGTAILAPAYSTYRIELGEISSYPRGYKENGDLLPQQPVDLHRQRPGQQRRRGIRRVQAQLPRVRGRQVRRAQGGTVRLVLSRFAAHPRKKVPRSPYTGRAIAENHTASPTSTVTAVGKEWAVPHGHDHGATGETA